jgi:5'/3'-nucleotidase SurE
MKAGAGGNLWIFLNNDDGIHAPWLWAIYPALQQEHQLKVVAPENEQSPVRLAISLLTPLRVKKARGNGIFFGWAISGTPADCIKLGPAHSGFQVTSTLVIHWSPSTRYVPVYATRVLSRSARS